MTHRRMPPPTTPPPTPPPAGTQTPSMSALIARSSLGARDARRARARVDVAVAQRIVERAARRPTAIRPQHLGG